MAFNFGSKLKVEIEDNQFIIDISNKKVIEAVQVITQKCITSTNDEAMSVDEFIDNSKSFIGDVLGEDAFEKIFVDKVVTCEDVTDLVCYILDEIGKFKNAQASKIINKYTPTNNLN
ncbi:MAG: hypothetical protein RR443_12450 [Anaerorhabdus sp.]|uniref:hypothetical protein n=1 Tax=Anaerorhabdus sp. TaxID=1872524 RepID=UPI002FCC2878